MGYLVDIAKTVPIEIGDFDFCKKGYNGWHDINIEDGNITRNSIKICKGLDKKKLVETVKHELGHQVYTAYLSDEEKTKWDDLYKQSTFGVDHLQAYSKTNTIEDFADTFATSYSEKKPIRSNLFNQKIDTIDSFKPTLKPRYNLFDFSNIKK